MTLIEALAESTPLLCIGFFRPQPNIIYLLIEHHGPVAEMDVVLTVEACVWCGTVGRLMPFPWVWEV